MKQNATSSMGALHPVFFFMIVYGISLFLALFVCRTVYYSINGTENSVSVEQKVAEEVTAVAYR